MLLMVVIIKCHPAFKMLLRVMKQSEFNTHLYMTYISKQDDLWGDRLFLSDYSHGY